MTHGALRRKRGQPGEGDEARGKAGGGGEGASHRREYRGAAAPVQSLARRPGAWKMRAWTGATKARF
ncbi:hypothetical protein STA1M1_08390 [Sinisalibacter aestuarii]|uniref:Uncharacterized protein n=1 Tax=Sinisalibacter aestuarii TaxID=2949426 RepID=A0ABQ5LPQ3_9RHOB|nr:hypothetical protein STA1M1_08390 [Sinisalibacter aestuarii]